MYSSDPSWYCLRTHPKHETVAAAHLRQVPGVVVFHPQLLLMRWTRRGWMRRSESLFPNYVFAQFTLETTLEKVRYTPAVKKVLEFGGKVPPIPDPVIGELRSTMQAAMSEVFRDAPVAGEEVEIAKGPFEGLKGKVIWVRPAKERVKVLLDILGNSVPAELSLESVLYRKSDAAQVVLSLEKPSSPLSTILNWPGPEQRAVA
jgi:transcription antitermination factor NusG